ncbi:integrase [Amycolatopsis sp. NPDC026612]|uniref:integrase n=1 Tax=Amycolatopsis sp. NPDC026612 TaxID=3155466 RepID=UPI0033E3E554
MRRQTVKKRAQERHRRGKGKPWQENGLVFASAAGTELDAHNVRRSFVSLLSDARWRIEEIARLCGHSGAAVTEQVHRNQIRPVIVEGALAMEGIFSARGGEGQSLS